MSSRSFWALVVAFSTFSGSQASMAQGVVYVPADIPAQQSGIIGYVPQRTGLFGWRTTMQPVVASSYVPVPSQAVPVTSPPFGSPTILPASPPTPIPRPVVTNYAPINTVYSVPNGAAYTPPQTYSAPVTVLRPTTIVNPPDYRYGTPASTPRRVGMPVIGH